MLVGQLDATIAARLAVIGADATLRAAAVSFARPRVGLLVVCQGDGGAVGVLSKSDLIRHLADPDPQATVAALMTRPIVGCEPHEDVHAVWQMMAGRGLRNVPVLDAAARPLGILDIRDAMRALFEEEELQERLLTNYIAGIGYQ